MVLNGGVRRQSRAEVRGEEVVPDLKNDIQGELYCYNYHVGKSAGYVMGVDQWMVKNGHKITKRELDTLQDTVNEVKKQILILERSIKSEQLLRMLGGK